MPHTQTLRKEMALCAEHSTQEQVYMHASHNPDTRFLSPGIHDRRFSGLTLSSCGGILGQFGWVFLPSGGCQGAGGLSRGIF